MQEAITIGRRIRQEELSVGVPDKATCVSACVLVLAAGVDRVAPLTAKIGIHRPYFSDLPEGSTTASIRRRREELGAAIESFLREMDVGRGLFDAMMAVPPSEVRYLGSEELARFRLLGMDPAYEEKLTKERAVRHGISMMEMRRRDGIADRTCANVRDSNRRFDCESAIRWDIPTQDFRVRFDTAIKECPGAHDDDGTEDACMRRVLRGGKP